MNSKNCNDEEGAILSSSTKKAPPRKKFIKAASCGDFDTGKVHKFRKLVSTSNFCEANILSPRSIGSLFEVSPRDSGAVSGKNKIYESSVHEWRKSARSQELKRKKLKPPPRRKRSKAAEHSDVATEHSVVAPEHSDVATEHSVVVTEHSDVASEHSDIATEYFDAVEVVNFNEDMKKAILKAETSPEMSHSDTDAKHKSPKTRNNAIHDSLGTKTVEEEFSEAMLRSVFANAGKESTMYQDKFFYREENLESGDLTRSRDIARSLKSIDVDIEEAPLAAIKPPRRKSKSLQSLLTSTPTREEVIFTDLVLGVSEITADDLSDAKATPVSQAETPPTFYRHKAIRRPSGFSQHIQSRRASFQDPVATYIKSENDVRSASPVRASVSIAYSDDWPDSNVESVEKANTIGALTENEYLHVVSTNAKKHQKTKKKRLLKKRIQNTFKSTTDCWPKSRKRNKVRRNTSSASQKKALEASLSNESFASLFLYNDVKGSGTLPDDLKFEPISSDIFPTDAKENMEFPPHAAAADAAGKAERRTLRYRLLHPKLLGTFTSTASLDSAALRKAQKFLSSGASGSKSKSRKNSYVSEEFSPEHAAESDINSATESRDTLYNIEEDDSISPTDVLQRKSSVHCVSGTISGTNTSKLSLKKKFFLRASSIQDLTPLIRKRFSKASNLATTSEGDIAVEQEDELKNNGQSQSITKSPVESESPTCEVGGGPVTAPTETNEEKNELSSNTQSQTVVQGTESNQLQDQSQGVKIGSGIPTIIVESFDVSKCSGELDVHATENSTANISSTAGDEVVTSKKFKLAEPPSDDARLATRYEGEHQRNGRKDDDSFQEIGRSSLDFNEGNNVVPSHSDAGKTYTCLEESKNRLLSLDKSENGNDSNGEHKTDLKPDSVPSLLTIEANETSAADARQEFSDQKSGSINECPATVGESGDPSKDAVDPPAMARDDHEKLLFNKQEEHRSSSASSVAENEANVIDETITDDASELCPPDSLVRENSVKQFAVKISPLSENCTGNTSINPELKDERVAKTQRCVDTGRVLISYNAPVDGEHMTVNLLQITRDEINSEIPSNGAEARVHQDTGKSSTTCTPDSSGDLNEFLNDLQSPPCSDCESPICNVPIITVTSSSQLANTTIPEQLHREITREFLENQGRRECFKNRSPSNLLRASGRRRIRANSIPECEELEDYDFENITCDDEESRGPSPMVARKAADNILEVTDTDDFFEFFRDRAHDEHYAHILESDSDNEQECAKAAVEYLLNARRSSIDTLLTQLSDETPHSRSKKSSEVGSLSPSNFNSRRESLKEETEEKIEDDIFDYFGDTGAVKKSDCTRDGSNENDVTSMQDAVLVDNVSVLSTHSTEELAKDFNRKDAEMSSNLRTEEDNSISGISEVRGNELRSSTSSEKTSNEQEGDEDFVAPEKPPRTFGVDELVPDPCSASDVKEQLTSTSSKPEKSTPVDSDMNNFRSTKRNSILDVDDNDDFSDYFFSGLKEIKTEANEAIPTDESTHLETVNNAVPNEEIEMKTSSCAGLDLHTHNMKLISGESGDHATENNSFKQQELSPSNRASDLNVIGEAHFHSERRKSFLDVDETDDIFKTFENSNETDTKIKERANTLQGEVSSDCAEPDLNVCAIGNFTYSNGNSASTVGNGESDEKLCSKLDTPENKLNEMNKSLSDIKMEPKATHVISFAETPADLRNAIKTCMEQNQEIPGDKETNTSDDHQLERHSVAVDDSRINSIESKRNTKYEIENRVDSDDNSSKHASPSPSLGDKNLREATALKNPSNTIPTDSFEISIDRQNGPVKKDLTEPMIDGVETATFTADTSKIHRTEIASEFPMLNSKLNAEFESNSDLKADEQMNTLQKSLAEVSPHVLDVSDVGGSRRKSFLDIDGTDDIFECFDSPENCDVPSGFHNVDLAKVSSVVKTSRECVDSAKDNENENLNQNHSREHPLVVNENTEAFVDNETSAKGNNASEILGVTQDTYENSSKFKYDSNGVDRDSIVDANLRVINVAENECNISGTAQSVENLNTRKFSDSAVEHKRIDTIENTEDVCENSSEVKITSSYEKNEFPSINQLSNDTSTESKKLTLDPDKSSTQRASNEEDSGSTEVKEKPDVLATVLDHIPICNEDSNLRNFTTNNPHFIDHRCRSGVEFIMHEKENKDQTPEDPLQGIKLVKNDVNDSGANRESSLDVNEYSGPSQSLKDAKARLGDVEDKNPMNTYSPEHIENDIIPKDFEVVPEQCKEVAESGIDMISKTDGIRGVPTSEEIMNNKNILISSEEIPVNLLTGESCVTEPVKYEGKNQRDSPHITHRNLYDRKNGSDESNDVISRGSASLESIVMSNYEKSTVGSEDDDFFEYFSESPNLQANKAEGKVSKIDSAQASPPPAPEESFKETSVVGKLRVEGDGKSRGDTTDTSALHHEQKKIECSGDESVHEITSTIEEKRGSLDSVSVVKNNETVACDKHDRNNCGDEFLIIDEDSNEDSVTTRTKEERPLKNQGPFYDEQAANSDLIGCQTTLSAQNYQHLSHDNKGEDSIIVVETYGLNHRRKSFLDIDETDDIFECFVKPQSYQSDLASSNTPERNAPDTALGSNSNSNCSRESLNLDERGTPDKSTSVRNLTEGNASVKTVPGSVTAVKDNVIKNNQGSRRFSSPVDVYTENPHETDYIESRAVEDDSSKSVPKCPTEVYDQYALKSASSITSNVLDDFRDKIITYGLGKAERDAESDDSFNKEVETSDRFSADQNLEKDSSSHSTFSAPHSKSSAERSSIGTTETATFMDVPQVQINGSPQHNIDNDDFFDYLEDFAPEENCSARNVCVDNCQPPCQDCKKPKVSEEFARANTSSVQMTDPTMSHAGETSQFEAKPMALANSRADNVTSCTLDSTHLDAVALKTNGDRGIRDKCNDENSKASSSSVSGCNDGEPSSSTIDDSKTDAMYENSSSSGQRVRRSGAPIALLRRDSEQKLIPQSCPCCPICAEEVSATLHNLSNKGTLNVKTSDNDPCLKITDNKPDYVEMQRSEYVKPPIPSKPLPSTSWERPEITDCIGTRTFILHPTSVTKHRFTVNKVAFYSNVMTASKPPRKYSSHGEDGRKFSTGAIPRILGLLKKRNSESSILAPSQKKLRPTRSVIESPARSDKAKVMRRSKSVVASSFTEKHQLSTEDSKIHWKNIVQRKKSLSRSKSFEEPVNDTSPDINVVPAPSLRESNLKVCVERNHHSSEPTACKQDTAEVVTKATACGQPTACKQDTAEVVTKATACGQPTACKQDTAGMETKATACGQPTAGGQPSACKQDRAGVEIKALLKPSISVSHETLLDPDDDFDKYFQKPDPNLPAYCHARKALFPSVSTSDLSNLERYDENFTPRSLAMGKPTIVLQTWRERQSDPEPTVRPAHSASDLTKLFRKFESSCASSATVGRSASFSPVTKKDTPSPSTPIDQYKEDTSDGHQLRHEERIQKDRSIDVYPETLRQRQRNMAPSPSKVDIKNWNQNEMPVRESSSPSEGKKFLPSVKALRSQFETGKSPTSGSSNGSVSPVSTFSNSSNGSGVVSAPSRPSNRGDSATTLSRKLSGSSLASSSMEKSSSNTSLNSAPSSENLLDGELTNEPVEPIFCQFQKVDEELRELMSRPTSTSGWDPRLVLKRLYYIPEMPRAHSKGNSYVNIEGFLEKLPSGRKKATFWNAWKKRYFVAKDGVLYYYQNSQCDKPSLRLTLMGGKVETMEANMVGVDDGPLTAEDNSARMIGVDDGKGHYVVMRCSSKSEAERWRKALETHLVEDFASQYVQPHPMTTNPTLLRDTLIIDIGSCSVRAGVLASQATLPQVFFPTVLATDRESRRQYWGPEALSPEVRSSSSISFPIRPSHRISKYSVDLTAVSSLLSKVFSELKVDPRSYNLQISVPRVLNQHTQSELIKILFEKFGVKGVNITHQSILALYAYNATSGIVVDIGERMDIVPVTDGYIIDGGVSRVPYGGYRILDHLRQFLHMRNVSLVNDVESYIIRQVLESACYCAQHYNTEKARCSKNPENFEKSVSLQEFFSNLAQCPYESVELDFGRFQATEGLFNPDAWGLDHPGLHKLVHKAIQECSMDIRKEMSRSIFLAGGVTQLPGLADRLTAELDNLTPPAIRPKVHVSPYRYHAAFIGACTLAESAAFPQSVVTKENWLKNGNAALRKWAL